MRSSTRPRRRLSIVAASAVLVLSALAAGPSVVAADGVCANAAKYSPVGDVGAGRQVYNGGGGVALCLHYNGRGDPIFWVQHIDLRLGARLRVASESSGGWFNKRTASQWYSWIPGNITPPPYTSLFSTTNASFFTNTQNGQQTQLSFPEKKGYTVTTTGASPDSYQKAFIGVPNGTSEPYTNVLTFPYTGNDPTTVGNLLASYKDAVVGYCANCGPNAAEVVRRTMLAGKDTDGNGTMDKIWIFTSFAGTYTAQQVYDYFRLNTAYATPYAVLMDGGNSTQFWSNYGSVDSALCPIPFYGCREVPDVIAVYEAW